MATNAQWHSNMKLNEKRVSYYWVGRDCLRCGAEYLSAKNKPGYCSNACKQAAYRDRKNKQS